MECRVPNQTRWPAHVRAMKRANWRGRRWRRKTAQGTQATARRAARAAPSQRVRNHPWRSRGDPLRERHRENSGFADALFDLAEPRLLDQLIHLGLGAAAHDPCLALAMAGERAC